MRKLLPGVLASFCLLAGPAAAQQPYPSRPIEIVVPFNPAGAISITFRLLAPSLSKRLGQPVVVVNKPGGGATLGMYQVAQAAPDGYTLGAASFAFAANAFLIDNMPYDPLKDFEPITMVASSPTLVLVNPKAPVTNMQEFINWAKSKPPEALNFGSGGIASSGHLIAELIMSRAGIRMTHIPYTTGAYGPLFQGEIDFLIGPIPSAMPWVSDGRLRAIAVTSLNPDPSVPGVPPVSRTLPGFDAYEWPGLVAPARTPRAIIDRLQREVALTIVEPEVKKQLANLGSQPAGSTPEEFGAFIRSEMAIWKEIALRIGKVDIK